MIILFGVGARDAPREDETMTIATAETTRTEASSIEVGDGGTFTVYTDRYAVTVIEVRRNGREIVLQRDKATLLNGFNSGEDDALTFTPGGFCGHTEGDQRYSYEPDPTGEKIRVTLRTRKDGSKVYKSVGTRTNEYGGVFRPGERREHYDFNF
jgi:hypothetical protein